MKQKILTLTMMLFAAVLSAQAQVKICMSYDDFKSNTWKPYSELLPGKEPDSCRVKYDGTEFSIKTSDKECNQAIKKNVFMMNIDNQLYINSRTLRDDDGGVLPISHYARALRYEGGKLLVVCYKVTLGDVLDLVNVGLDDATGSIKCNNPYLSILMRASTATT